MRTFVFLGALSIALTAGSQQVDPPKSLVVGLTAYYPFDINAEDQSGYGLGADASPAVNYVPGVHGNAASFTTSDATITLPRLPPVNSFTVAAWVLWSYGTVAPDDLRTIVSRLYLQPSTGKLVYFYQVDGPGKQTESLFWSHGTIAQSGWHHVAVTHDASTNRLQFYIDGKADSSIPSPRHMRAPFTPTRVNSIGSEGKASGKGAYINGAIDELLLYDRALTPAEVLYLTTVKIASSSMSAATQTLTTSTSCGNAYETPCRFCLEHYWFPPWKWGDCEYYSGKCNSPNIYHPYKFTCTPPPSVPPQFTVTELPAIIQIDDVRTLQNVIGYQATITHAKSAVYVVNDSRSVGN